MHMPCTNNTSDLKQSNMLLAAAAFVLTQVHTVKKTARQFGHAIQIWNYSNWPQGKDGKYILPEWNELPLGHVGNYCETVPTFEIK